MSTDKKALKEKLLTLSASIHKQHQSGAGKVSLTELAFLLQVPLTPQQEALLAARGNVDFKKASPDGGTFENKGSEVNLQLPMATLVVPPLVAGKYQSGPNKLILDFDSGKTLTGKKGFLTAPLEQIGISESKLTVRVGGMLGGILSQNIALG